MAIVTVNSKYQILIPRSVREEAGVSVGDVFEAKAHKGTIVFELKSDLDRALAEGLADVKAGRVSGPFSTVDDMLASLKGTAKKQGKKPHHNMK